LIEDKDKNEHMVQYNMKKKEEKKDFSSYFNYVCRDDIEENRYHDYKNNAASTNA
jgi:hypothetical protein